jgi:multiple sugar transport system substrate-binding protein
VRKKGDADIVTVRLHGITWDHPRGYQPLHASAEPYQQQTGVSVTWDKRSLKDFGDAPIDRLAEEYDLLIIDHPHVGLASASGCLLPLDDCLDAATLKTLAEQSAGPSHTSYFYHGRQWGLAIDAAMQASAYRADLLDEPLPDDWDAVISLGERLRSRGLYLVIPLCPTDAICSFLTLCANLGDPPGQMPGEMVSVETGQRALEILNALRDVAHPDSLDWNPIHTFDRMSSGDELAYCPLAFCYTNYARAGYKPHIVRFHNIPGVKGTILGGTGFAVSSRCRHPEAACAYGAWLCGAEVQRGLYLEEGGQPGNVIAWQDAAANRLTNNFFGATLATLEAAYVRPRHNGFVTFQERAGELINRHLRERSPVADCLASLRDLYAANYDA